MKTGIVILTLNAEKHIEYVLKSLLTGNYKILVVDSESTDDTVLISKTLGAEVLILNRSDFNHGATRELVRKKLNVDIIVFMTQDAYPKNNNIVDVLIEPIVDGRVAFSYARQIPHNGATLLESLPREFNYGTEPQIRGIRDSEKYGVYNFFCSNTCAAYLNRALDDIGGFKPTLTNEDYFACAELLLKGYKVAYVPEAIVRHSHKYTLKQEFQRYFDTGYVRAEKPFIQDLVGEAEKRGYEFIKILLERLVREKPYLIPYALMQSIVKSLGYKIGFNGRKLPLFIKKLFSGQKYYWSSIYYSSD